MKFQNHPFIFIFFLAILLVGCAKTTQPVVDQTTIVEISISQKVKTLLGKMTLEDKVGEMTQLSLDMLCVGEPYNLKEPLEFDQVKLKKVLVDLKVGSILNNGGHARSQKEWISIINTIQEIATTQKKTKIPVLYGIDAIHGANYSVGGTLYPQQIGLAATWNTDLVKELAAISAYETRACAIPWSFSPVLDLGRDIRWSRFWETFGEDPYLVTEMGKAIFEGTQGANINHPEKVVGCMKHFVGYSMPLTGKDRTSSWIPERQLREFFLPSFQAAVDAGAKTVMINSGDINGIPVHADSRMLKGLLRDELGFKGVAVTDWEDIVYLVKRHKVAKDYKDAIRISINAGIDMSMVPVDLDFPRLLKELVQEGKVPMSRIDEAVSRILTLKYELGLFENPVGKKHQYPDFGSKKFQQKALQAALESMTLLKNKQSILPLFPKSKILITGPTAHSLNALNGSWTGTWQGVDPKWNTKGKQTILEAMQKEFGSVDYVPGVSVDTVINIQRAIKAAKSSDVAVICVGEFPYVEKPGDVDDIVLPEAQLQLVEAIAKTGTPIVLVVVEGRPRIISKIEPLVQAILMAYLPGDEGGVAIASTLSGKNNPSGKLPFTYPRNINSLETYDYKGTDMVDRYFGNNAINPQWAFGHGLSYTKVEYSDMMLDTKELVANGSVLASVFVKNVGTISMDENVLCFVSDLVASVAPPNKRLRGFQKISLKPNVGMRVFFKINAKDLAFVGIDNKWVVEPGEFEVTIGGEKQKFILR